MINNDKVIIKPIINDAEIENQILDISIKRVKDLRNNELESTVTWTAFIDQNNVVWDKQKLSIEKFVEEEIIVRLNIKNNGGINENYQITNIPSWMEVSPSSGVLTPLEVLEVSITIKAELNIGKYQQDINLVASMEFNERLGIDLKVKGHAPDWSVEPKDYEFAASIIGQLSFSDVISTDTDDIVACFVGGECRGLANVSYLQEGDIYLCFMSIYSNDEQETMNFKVWDASTGHTYSRVTPVINFVQDGVYGSVSAPLPIKASNFIDQTVDLVSGWNWVSFNVWSEEFNNLNTAFINLTKTSTDAVKSQSSLSVVTGNVWFGDLNKLDHKSTYKMYVNKAQSLVMSGYKVISDTVQTPIFSGWNWIGYPSQSIMPLTDAFSSLIPTENDLIKSQYQFAIYDNSLGWIGSLEFMEPGKGYILYSQSPGTLQFSSSGAKSSIIAEKSGNNTAGTEHNMCIIAKADIDNPALYSIAAYDDDNVLCGTAKPRVLDDGRVYHFLTINSELPHKIKFKAESPFDTLLAKEVIPFAVNGLYGDLGSPYLLTFGNSTSSTGNKFLNSLDVTVYPNPFDEKISVKLFLNEASQVSFSLYNILGERIGFREMKLPGGKHQFDLLKELQLNLNMSSGFYLLKVNSGTSEQILKVTKR